MATILKLLGSKNLVLGKSLKKSDNLANRINPANSISRLWVNLTTVALSSYVAT